MDRDHHDPRGVLPAHSVLVLALLTVSAPAAWSLGVGRPQAASSLGQPLNLLFPVQLNPGESLTPDCVRAEVSAGDNPLAPWLSSAVATLFVTVLCCCVLIGVAVFSAR